MALDVERFGALSLDDARAIDPTLTGAKAANLARAATAKLPVLPGFVLVPAEQGAKSVEHAWRELSRNGAQALVVRSSSAQEDTEESSMAGRFESVLDVQGWSAFLAAVTKVQDSADVVEGSDGTNMAVLVQPMLQASAGGILFSADPITGRTDRMLVSGVRGGPHQLVDGSTQGTRYQLTRHARLLSTEPEEQRVLTRRQLCALVRLARRAEKVFLGPQDMEFGFDADNKLWLFQSRPITALAPRPLKGRLLGPGPVAETFPDVLQPLEEDLWIAPMSHGLTLALDIARAMPRRLLRSLPAVRTVRGRAVADLALLGAVPHPHPFLNFINPSPGVRRVSAAWRMGRLRVALPHLATDLLAETDRQLALFPAPVEMMYGQLLSALSWARAVLSSLHAQESLAGALLGSGSGRTGASEALAVLAEGREQGLSDPELLAHHPVLLVLTPPALSARTPAPLPERVGWTGASRGVWALPVREGLRLRIRWVQEMQVSMAREIGRRLCVRGDLVDAAHIGRLRWVELQALGEGKQLPADVAERMDRPAAAPLPPVFRLINGEPVAGPSGARNDGQGAGGGFGTGVVWDAVDQSAQRPQRPILVVRTLDPALAPLLPDLAGLVAETGSVLSHLAVLAREYQVPTVVGVNAALDRFPPGTSVSVDGVSGAVERVKVAA